MENNRGEGWKWCKTGSIRIAKGFEGMEQRIAPPIEMTFLTRTYGREKADLSCVTGYYYDKRRFFFFDHFLRVEILFIIV